MNEFQQYIEWTFAAEADKEPRPYEFFYLLILSSYLLEKVGQLPENK